VPKRSRTRKRYMHRGSSGSVSAKQEFSGTAFAIISGISPLEGCSSKCKEFKQCWTYIISLVKVEFRASSFVIVCLKSVGVPAKALRTMVICLKFDGEKDLGSKGCRTNRQKSLRQTASRSRPSRLGLNKSSLQQKEAHLVSVKSQWMPTLVPPTL
jgi:hypothetical protein